MSRREWRWWEEFDETDPGSKSSGDGRRRAELRAAVVLRWAATVGWSLLAVFKALDGAWLFALGYAACAVGFFVAYGVASRRRRDPTD